MPYRVKVSSVTAIVANEKQALEMIPRLVGTGNEEVFIKDIFGSEVDVATLESRASRPSREVGGAFSLRRYFRCLQRCVDARGRFFQSTLLTGLSPAEPPQPVLPFKPSTTRVTTKTQCPRESNLPLLRWRFKSNLTQPMLLYNNSNFIRNDWRVERIMTGIAEHELERMFAGGQFDTCLGLTRSKMKMGFILRNRFVGI